MSRTRFVKLLMGVGATRNEACEIAGRRPPTVSYKDYYPNARMMAILGKSGTTLKKACKAVGKVTIAFADASAAFDDMVNAISAFCTMGVNGWLW